MSVLLGGMNFIISVPVLNEKYPGGLAAYRDSCVNPTFCSDGRITRVGCRGGGEGFRHAVRLGDAGLVHADYSVIGSDTAPHEDDKWLEYRRDWLGYAYVWDARFGPGRLAAPEGWTALDPHAALFGIDGPGGRPGLRFAGTGGPMEYYEYTDTRMRLAIGPVEDLEIWLAESIKFERKWRREC